MLRYHGGEAVLLFLCCGKNMLSQRMHAVRAGSCLVLAGNGADVAMHCVPPVKRRRMSITLRK